MSQAGSLRGTLLGRVDQKIVIVIHVRGLIVLDGRHAFEMIKVVPDLIGSEYVTHLGDEKWQLPSEFRSPHRRFGKGLELFADQVVERIENTVLDPDTASCRALLLPDVLEPVLRHCTSRLTLDDNYSPPSS